MSPEKLLSRVLLCTGVVLSLMFGYATIVVKLKQETMRQCIAAGRAPLECKAACE